MSEDFDRKEFDRFVEDAMDGVELAVLSLSRRKEYFKAAGECYWLFYQGLQEAGFVPDDAMDIVKRQTFTGGTTSK